MKVLNNINACKGIGIIEIIVTTLVISFGLLAIVSMQVDFMSSSGTVKTQSEALKLAEEKIEQLRNQINKTEFAAVATGTDTLDGSNASFTRSWTVTDQTDPARKVMSVAVAWGNAADEKVNLVTEVAWADPGKAVRYSTGGNGLSGIAPTPNNYSSTPGAVLGQPDSYNVADATALNDGSGLFTHVDGEDNKLLLDDQGGVIFTFFGGKILTIKGSVYLNENTFGDYTVDVSEEGYCVFPLSTETTTTVGGDSFVTADYICYVGGDCSQTSAGSNGCPSDSAVLANLSDISGGWYGKVGITGFTNNSHKQLCFAEDLSGNTTITSSRLYVTRRLDANGNVDNSEGINQSYACQDYLVINSNGQQSTCTDYTELTVASTTIDRSLAVNDANVVLAEDFSSCPYVIAVPTAYTITGSIEGPLQDQVRLTIDGSTCTIDGNYDYVCEISTSDSEVTILASGGNVDPTSTTISVESSNPSFSGETYSTTDNVEVVDYTISGSITGPQQNQVSIEASNGLCSINTNTYDYICTVTTSGSSTTITASGGEVLSPSSETITLDPGVTVVIGQSYDTPTPAPVEYIITGNIVGSNERKVSVYVEGNSCRIETVGNGSNAEYTYYCTITTSAASAAISATTSQNNGSVSPASATVDLSVGAVTGPDFTSS